MKTFIVGDKKPFLKVKALEIVEKIVSNQIYDLLILSVTRENLEDVLKELEENIDPSSFIKKVVCGDIQHKQGREYAKLIDGIFYSGFLQSLKTVETTDKGVGNSKSTILGYSSLISESFALPEEEKRKKLEDFSLSSPKSKEKTKEFDDSLPSTSSTSSDNFGPKEEKKRSDVIRKIKKIIITFKKIRI